MMRCAPLFLMRVVAGSNTIGRLQRRQPVFIRRYDNSVVTLLSLENMPCKRRIPKAPSRRTFGMTCYASVPTYQPWGQAPCRLAIG